MTKFKYVINRNLKIEYGDAVNHCIKYNLNLNQIEPMSHNKNIENVCGKRPKGMLMLFPFELDYFCPICGEPPKMEWLDTNEEELLHIHFSEYNYFMWCERCNIDIPSFLCLKADSKDAVNIYTERFLEMVKTIQLRRQLKNTQDNFIKSKEQFIKDLIKRKIIKKKFRNKILREIKYET